MEVRRRKPGPWRPSHGLSIPIYQGKVYSQSIFEDCAIQFFFLFLAYPNSHVVPYSLAVPKACVELQHRVSAQDLCFTGRKGPIFWGPASGKRTCPLRGPELCSRLTWFHNLSLHALPP
jgi:hypothetical protein